MKAPMKITAFNGSPRAEKGNTHIMVEAFLEGAKEAGAETENIFLVRKRIGHCLGCFTCWTKTPGKCVIKDDMQELIDRVVVSNIVVFATPLYVDNVTGIMKNFFDRLIPIADPHFEKDGFGEYRHIMRHPAPPKLVAISNCGFPEQSHFQVLKLLFRRMARNLHSEVIAEIYRGGGELLKADNILLKPVLWNYKRLLKRAGIEVVKDGRLSAGTTSGLERPLIPGDTYIKKANGYWDKCLRRS